MQKITPFLCFDGKAEEAARFYVSVFKGKIRRISRYTEAGPAPAGSVMLVEFDILGQNFVALNGGPDFKFNQAISFVVHCQTQREVDAYWRKLTAGGGEPIQCGWLKDKYGVSWQITPEILLDFVGGKDRGKAQRAMEAMFKMTKIDIKRLKRAVAKR